MVERRTENPSHAAVNTRAVLAAGSEPQPDETPRRKLDLHAVVHMLIDQQLFTLHPHTCPYPPHAPSRAHSLVVGAPAGRGIYM